MLVAAAALVAVSAVAGASARTGTGLPRSALVPNTVAFIDRLHGILGTGATACVHGGRNCRLQGTISVSSDGGRTWRVVRRTPNPVVSAAYFHDAYYVRLLDGTTYWATSAGGPWQQGHRISFVGYCPKGWNG